MSSAFVKEGEYQELSDVSPSLSALSFYLRQENKLLQRKMWPAVYEMSDGPTYALSDENKWIIILEGC
jgi:hypothetical protein